MAATSWDASIAEVLASEGGWSDHPRDPGGATNRGITIAVFRAWRGDYRLGPKDLRALDEAEARAIYRAEYWNATHCDELPPGVDHQVFDMAVNAGVRRSSIQLQDVVGADPDGVIGPRTLARVALFPDKVPMIIDGLERTHEAFYRSLRNWDVFGKGWMARLGRRTALARELNREA